MAFSLTTLPHVTATIAFPSNSASSPILRPCTSQPSPQLMRFSSVVTKQSTGQVVSSALPPPDPYGGKYVSENLTFALSKLESAFNALPTGHELQKEFTGMLRNYVCRESPLYFAERLTEYFKRPNGEGPEIYLKREDFHPPGLYKINNAIGQALLAKKLGKTRIVTETGVGEHGVATATICSHYGLQCVIYMGVKDMEKQAIKLFRMMNDGAKVIPVHYGTATLSDARPFAIRDWVQNRETTHYLSGSGGGPHPYPKIVREFHSVIGKETRKQAMEIWGGKPDVLVSCVDGESNAMGLFHEFVEDKEVRLIGVEGTGFLLDSGRHAHEVGVLDGVMRYFEQDDGQIIDLLPITTGMEYPEQLLGRAELHSITDEEALDARKRLTRLEGIMTGTIEVSYALAYLEKLCPTLANGTKVVLNCGSRGDKDGWR